MKRHYKHVDIDHEIEMLHIITIHKNCTGYLMLTVILFNFSQASQRGRGT